MTNEPRDPERDASGFYVDLLHRLLQVLAERALTVIDANRYAEDHGDVRNRTGANNLNEAFSHLAALVQDAPNLSYDEQLAQIVELEDHMRRSMMESFEQVAKYRLGKIKQAGLWDKYQRRSAPLIARGKLSGAPDADEIRELEIRVRYYLREGSNRKVVTRRARQWNEWVEGAEHFSRAAEAAKELADKLRQAIGAAQDYRRTRLGIVVGLLALLAGIAGVIVALTVK